MTPKDRLAWKKANPIQKEEDGGAQLNPSQIELQVEVVPDESTESETVVSPTTVVEVNEDEDDDHDDDVAQVEEFEHEGTTYYRDDDNLVYENLEEDEPTPMECGTR